jgi:hypothetical protein
MSQGGLFCFVCRDEISQTIVLYVLGIFGKLSMNKGVPRFEIICSYGVEVMLLLESPTMMKSGLLSKAYEKIKIKPLPIILIHNL